MRTLTYDTKSNQKTTWPIASMVAGAMLTGGVAFSGNATEFRSTQFNNFNANTITISGRKTDEEISYLNVSTFVGGEAYWANINDSKTVQEETYPDLQSINEININYKESNFESYLDLFFTDYTKNKLKYNLDLEPILNRFVSVANEVSKIQSLAQKVNIIPDGGLKFVLKLSNERTLMISNVLDEDFNSDDIVFSLFQNKDLIQSDLTNVKSFVTDVRKYLDINI